MRVTHLTDGLMLTLLLFTPRLDMHSVQRVGGLLVCHASGLIFCRSTTSGALVFTFFSAFL